MHGSYLFNDNIKKKWFLPFFVFLTFTTINAQENVIKFNPAALAFSSLEVNYERIINSTCSVEFAIAATNQKVNFGSIECEIFGFAAELKYKLYFPSSSYAPRGWYAAPLISYTSANGSFKNQIGDVKALGGGIVAGYQIVFGNRSCGFTLDFNFGAQYLPTKTNGDITDVDFEGILPRVGVSLGFAW